MNNLLIITAVSSVLGTLTFSYLVWLRLGLRKALKQSEESLSWLKGLEESTGRMQKDTWREFDETKRVLMQRDDELHKEMMQRIEHQSDTLFGEDRKTHDEINNVRKDIDRRFDRVYHKLYTEFPQLKEVEQSTDY
jgi:hypothetical protein